MRHIPIGIVVTLTFAHALAETEATINTIIAPKVEYERIEFMTTSPAVWVRDMPPDQGRYLRLVVYAPIEESPQEMRVESWTYGDEGCCQRLVRSRQFTLAESLREQFGPFKATACKTNFVFQGWLSLTSFRFSYLCKQFVAQDVHKEAIRVSAAR